jgi:HAD superfamily hydrolase (TIGR01509 family)
MGARCATRLSSSSGSIQATPNPASQRSLGTDEFATMTTPIATVLFDLGGVVCRFQPERRLLALASACGLPAYEVQARIWDSGFDRDCDQGRYTAHEVYQRTQELVGLQASYEEFRRLWALAFDPDPAVLAVADALRPWVRTGLLTDNGPVLRDAMPALFPEINSRFDPLLFSCDLGHLKPTRELFTAVLQRLNQRADQVLLVDDAPPVVAGAIACGLRACLYRSPHSLRRELKRHGLY